MKQKLLNGLNTLLMVDLFLVLASFFWFAAAVIGRSAGIHLGLDIWYSLWDPIFTPAIGILMAGAMCSGLTSWVLRRFAKESSP